MNGQYEPGEKQQEVQITFRFKTKHNPGTPEHLAQLICGDLDGKRGYKRVGKDILEV
jgi:hypothetical protein